MTADVIPLRRQRLPEDVTRAGLEDLARKWDDSPRGARRLALRGLTHPSLTDASLQQLWEHYRHVLDILDDIDHGIGLVDWHHFSSDRETARDNVVGEVDYAALDLIHGITGPCGGSDVA